MTTTASLPPAGRARCSRGRRPIRARVLAVVLVAASATLPLVGATWAAFSDHDVFAAQTVQAGRLIVVADGDGIALGPLQRDGQGSDQIDVINDGTVTADLAVVFEGFDGLCSAPTSMAGQLFITLAGSTTPEASITRDVCDLTGESAPFTFAEDVPAAPETRTTLLITASLAAAADPAWRGAVGVSAIRIVASQPGGGFSDLDVSSVAISVGDWVLPSPNPYPDEIGDHLPPATCLPDSEYSWIITIHGLNNLTLDFSQIDLSVAPDLRQLFGASPDKWSVQAGGGNASKGVRIDASSSPLTIIGTPKNDCVVVRNGTYVVHGGDGDDILITQGGSSTTFFGGNGNDILYGAGEGARVFYAGAGNNLLYTHASGATTFYGGTGNDVLHSTGNGATSMFGMGGNNILYYTGPAAGTLVGGSGDDYLYNGGNVMNTTLDGGGGSNVCVGGGRVVTNCHSGSAMFNIFSEEEFSSLADDDPSAEPDLLLDDEAAGDTGAGLAASDGPEDPIEADASDEGAETASTETASSDAPGSH